MPDNIYLSNTAQPITTWSGTTTVAGTGDVWHYYESPDYQEPVIISTPYVYPTPLNNNKKGDDDMRYLFEVILVNPKNDDYAIRTEFARSETSALMKAYEVSHFKSKIDFDDLKTSCRELMSWKKEKSLKKAIETIKEAVE